MGRSYMSHNYMAHNYICHKFIGMALGWSDCLTLDGRLDLSIVSSTSCRICAHI